MRPGRRTPRRSTFEARRDAGSWPRQYWRTLPYRRCRRPGTGSAAGRGRRSGLSSVTCQRWMRATTRARSGAACASSAPGPTPSSRRDDRRLRRTYSSPASCGPMRPEPGTTRPRPGVAAVVVRRDTSSFRHGVTGRGSARSSALSAHQPMPPWRSRAGGRTRRPAGRLPRHHHDAQDAQPSPRPGLRGIGHGACLGQRLTLRPRRPGAVTAASPGGPGPGRHAARVPGSAPWAPVRRRAKVVEE